MRSLYTTGQAVSWGTLPQYHWSDGRMIGGGRNPPFVTSMAALVPLSAGAWGEGRLRSQPPVPCVVDSFQFAPVTSTVVTKLPAATSQPVTSTDHRSYVGYRNERSAAVNRQRCIWTKL